MAFRTKLDFSNNRQVKQDIETTTVLSGATNFGVPFGNLPTGPNLLTSGVTQNYFVLSDFSGNNTTTNFTWGDPIMVLGEPYLSAITPTNSATTQTIDPVFYSETTTVIDGNLVNLTYTGFSYDVDVLTMDDLGGGNYSGTVQTNDLFYLSAGTLDFTGRTIWADVSGITRTDRLIVTNNPQVGYVLTCIDSEGMVGFLPSSGGTSGLTPSIWVAGTGISSAVLSGSGGFASGDYSVVEGYYSSASGFSSHAEGATTVASGAYSHSEGKDTFATGNSSHAEGDSVTAIGVGSHAEGNGTQANGDASHAEGVGTIASGNASHAEGSATQANGIASFAGGTKTIANGNTSFVYGSGSTTNADYTIVLGNGITGSTTNTTYVDYLNIKRILSTASVNDVRVDANGNLTTNTSDERLKENITPLTGALAKIKALQGVTYQWKDRKAGTDAVKLGFIAQQVEIVEPLLVFTNKDEDGYKGLHIDGVIPLLVEAIKEITSGVASNQFLETQTILAEDNNIDLNYNGTAETGVDGGIRVLHAKGSDLSADLVTDSEGNWTTNNDFKPNTLTIPQYTPTSSSDMFGTLGNIARDEDYVYVKTSTGWKRANLESF
jgi:hypothetical protein